MEKYEQMQFVMDLTNNIKAAVLDLIKHGKIPAEWDGHELRCFLAERFDDAASATVIRREKRSRRTREYHNYVLVNL